MRRIIWPALLTIPAAWPLTAVAQFDSDDGILHLFRLNGLDDALRQGATYAPWFSSFAFGYGHRCSATMGRWRTTRLSQQIPVATRQVVER
jgi:hypothetical protein